MKPAPFDYYAPESIGEAVELLARHGDDAKVLAGGQSYIPAMSFRLARAAVLVDLNRIQELFFIEPCVDPGGGGGVRIGSMTRQRTVERSALIRQRCPLVHGTLPFVAHAQIRNRGTFGGSIAHADPAAELPAVLLALGGRLRIRSSTGERWVAARDFFTGLFETALGPEDLLVELELLPAPERSGWGFHEMARRHGDYALVGVAAQMVLDTEGRVAEASIVLLSVGDGPVFAHRACAVLRGTMPTSEALEAASQAAGHEDIDPPGDIHASQAYRRHLAVVLTRRALEDAVQRAAASPALAPK